MNPPMDAPVDMVVNPLWQWIFGVLHFGGAGLTIYLVLRNPMRHRDWWKVLFRNVILCSGALGAVVFEGAGRSGRQTLVRRAPGIVRHVRFNVCVLRVRDLANGLCAPLRGQPAHRRPGRHVHHCFRCRRDLRRRAPGAPE